MPELAVLFAALAVVPGLPWLRLRGGLGADAELSIFPGELTSTSDYCHRRAPHA